MMLRNKKGIVEAVMFVLMLGMNVFTVFAQAEEAVTEMPEAEYEMTEVSREVVDQAYDEAKIKIDSDISRVTMEEVNYQLSVLMNYLNGMSTDEFKSALEDFTEETLVSVDDLIVQADEFISGSDAGETGLDLSGYENAVASWKKMQEALHENAQLSEETAEQDVFDSLSPESQMDYLEAAMEVDRAVWEVIKADLGTRLGGLTELADELAGELDIDLKEGVEEGMQVASGIMDFINEVRLKIDVGFDEERFENRARISSINNSFNLLCQTLRTVCQTVSIGGTVSE